MELLLALPQARQRYGHPFDENLAGEFGRFGFGPVDQAAKSLYIEAREATKSMDDIAADAFMLRAAEPRLRRARAAAANEPEVSRPAIVRLRLDRCALSAHVHDQVLTEVPVCSAASMAVATSRRSASLAW